MSSPLLTSHVTSLPQALHPIPSGEERNAKDIGDDADGTATNGDQQPQKRRRRPALACEQCRRRKIKCDRNVPCNHCLKSNISTCSYAPTHVPASRTKKKSAQAPRAEATSANGSSLRPILPATSTDLPAEAPGLGDNIVNPVDYGMAGPSTSLATISTDPPPRDFSKSTTGSPSSGSRPNVEQLIHTVHHLQEKLAKVVTISNDEASPFSHGKSDNESLPSHGIVSKISYFGRTHWMNAAFTLPFVRELSGRIHIEAGQDNEIGRALKRCKALGRTIKEHRQQPLSSLSIGKHGVSRELADRLVEAYFRTFEGVFRILHVPTFRAEYERYWQAPETTGDFFTIQLQLVMAIGASFADDVFSMRSQAHQWIHEAQLWLMLPPEKSRMTIPGLQIMCLLTLSRSACGVGQDLVWISAGAMVRKAIHMGLHRDPSQLGAMTVYRAEMRRRLWATILELNLQCSFDAGGPPLISWKDHDVLPPANLDDEELSDEVDSVGALGQPPEKLTQTSVQLELYKSLAMRLRLLEHANDFRTSGSYDDTLRFNSDVTKACRRFYKNFALFVRSQQGDPKPRVNAFHAALVDLILYRCFHTLHQPVISQSLDDPKFYFSRKMYLDGALRIMSVCGMAGIESSSLASGAPDNGDFHRISVNGAGLFHIVPIQSLQAILLELVYKGELADLSLGYLPSVAGSFDLSGILGRFVDWSLRRLRSGETNVKGYCFPAVSYGYILALQSGMAPEELERNLGEVVHKHLQIALEELEGVARREGIAADLAGETFQMADTEAMMLDLQDLDWMGDWAWDDDMAGIL